MASGYTYCACPECFEIVVSNDISNPDYCDECIEAGCPEDEGMDRFPTECRKISAEMENIS